MVPAHTATLRSFQWRLWWAWASRPGAEPDAPVSVIADAREEPASFRAGRDASGSVKVVSEPPEIPTPIGISAVREASEQGLMAGMGLLSAIVAPDAAQAAAAAVAGGTVMFETFFGVAAGRRRYEWELQVTAVLHWLVEQRGLPEARLQADEFVDAVVRASQIAAADSTEAKRRALMNALCNVGTGTAPSRDRQMILLRLLDQATELHMRALGQLLRSEAIEQRSGSQDHDSVPDVLVAHMPQFAGNQELAETVAKELENMGLIVDMLEDGQGLFSIGTPWRPGRTITSKGKDFVGFITGPFDQDE